MMRRVVRGSGAVTSSLALVGKASFASSPLLRADPSEEERERQLREKLNKNPQAAWGGEKAQTSQSKPGENPDMKKAWEAFAQSTGKGGGFWHQFGEFKKLRDSQRAGMRAGADTPPGGEGASTSSSTFGGGAPAAGANDPHWGRFFASCIVFYVAFQLFFKSQGADVSSTLVPFWVTNYETQAKYLLMQFSLSQGEREQYQTMFTQARQTRPLLTFYDYLDEVAPHWCSGTKFPGHEVVATLTGALATLSQWQVVSLTNRIHYNLSGHKGSVQDKVDIVLDTTRQHLGSSRSMAANLIGQQGSGQPMTMRLTGGGDGTPQRLMDSQGNSIPFYTGAPPTGTAYVSHRSFPMSEAPPGAIPTGMPGGGPGGAGSFPPGTAPSAVIPMYGGTPTPGGMGGGGMAPPASFPPSTAAPTMSNPSTAGFGDTMSSEKGHGTVPVFK